MLLPHMYDFHKVGWDEIYRDWESDDLKYYWRRHNYRRVKKNTSFRERGTAEAMQLARGWAMNMPLSCCGGSSRRQTLKPSRLWKRGPFSPRRAGRRTLSDPQDQITASLGGSKLKF